jgi:hypothetical protein
MTNPGGASAPASHALEARPLHARAVAELGVTSLRQTMTELLYPLGPADRAFREQVKTLLATPLFAAQPGLTCEQQATQSYARFRCLREALDLRVTDITERPARMMTVLELAGTVDGTLFTIMSIHYCLCAGSILRDSARSPELQSYLAELDGLESIGTYLLTELGFGNNVVALQTRADYDANRREVVLNTPSAAAIKFMPNTGLAGVPKVAVVLARLFVDARDEGAGRSPFDGSARLARQRWWQICGETARVPRRATLASRHCQQGHRVAPSNGSFDVRHCGSVSGRSDAATAPGETYRPRARWANRSPPADRSARSTPGSSISCSLDTVVRAIEHGQPRDQLEQVLALDALLVISAFDDGDEQGIERRRTELETQLPEMMME